MEEPTSGDRGQLADGHWANQELRRRGGGRCHQRRDRLHRRRVRHPEQPPLREDAEPGRQVRAADPGEDRDRVQSADQAAPRRIALDREPADHGGSTSNAYPISTYTYVDVANKSSNAAALKKLIGWAILNTAHKGQTYGPALLFVPIPPGVVAFDKKQIAKIHS